jgi:hypothetical protein
MHKKDNFTDSSSSTNFLSVVRTFNEKEILFNN